VKEDIEDRKDLTSRRKSGVYEIGANRLTLVDGCPAQRRSSPTQSLAEPHSCGHSPVTGFDALIQHVPFPFAFARLLVSGPPLSLPKKGDHEVRPLTRGTAL